MDKLSESEYFTSCRLVDLLCVSGDKRSWMPFLVALPKSHLQTAMGVYWTHASRLWSNVNNCIPFTRLMCSCL